MIFQKIVKRVHDYSLDHSSNNSQFKTSRIFVGPSKKLKKSTIFASIISKKVKKIIALITFQIIVKNPGLQNKSFQKNFKKFTTTASKDLQNVKKKFSLGGPSKNIKNHDNNFDDCKK